MAKKKSNKFINFITNPKYIMVLATIGIFLAIYIFGAVLYGDKGFTKLRTFAMLFVDNAYIGKTLSLTVSAQAVQSENNPADFPWEVSGWPAE